MIEVLQAGVQTTVQDRGRPGLRHWGVAQGGAADAEALALANALVGNPPDAAGLEVWQGPVRLHLHGQGTLAVAGADFAATLAGRALRPGWRAAWRPGDELVLAARPRHGACAVLAVAGGVDVPLCLGARGTDLAGGWGGWQGRALRAGDRLPLGPCRVLAGHRGVAPLPWRTSLRALPGPEHDSHFDARTQAAFWAGVWRVSPQSNRMGARLSGPVLQGLARDEMPSQAVMPGVVQVPGGGQPIALRVDAQSTGGYPRIAVVIAADAAALAQWPAGAELRFERVDASTAQRAAAQREAEHHALLQACQRWLR